MATTHSDSALFLREPTDRQRDEAPNGYVEDETEEEASEEEHILCRQCHNVLTSLNEQIEVQGSQKHTFANPHGIVFEIGCFRAVMGCGYAGPASDEFSWFKGFSWRAAVCVMCLTHLGWLFESRSGSSFHGLILDRLLFR
jgi:hypothetical protein